MRYATYHREISLHSKAKKLNIKFTSEDILQSARQPIAKVLKENKDLFKTIPNIIGIMSNGYYDFYYLSNGDRIDVRK